MHAVPRTHARETRRQSPAPLGPVVSITEVRDHPTGGPRVLRPHPRRVRARRKIPVQYRAKRSGDGVSGRAIDI